MARVAVFDSGLGSLSVIGPLMGAIPLDVVYYADTRSFPYGRKAPGDLRRIVAGTISGLRDAFAPDVIVVGSNTPSILFPDMIGGDVVGVYPPLGRAAAATRTGGVAILGTGAALSGPEIRRYVGRCGLPERVSVSLVPCGPLIALVEAGMFRDDARCGDEILGILSRPFAEGMIDAATLSSTHLPFLRGALESAFPDVRFFDPADDVVRAVGSKVRSPGGPGSLEVFTSGDAEALSGKLRLLGIRGAVGRLVLGP